MFNRFFLFSTLITFSFLCQIQQINILFAQSTSSPIVGKIVDPVRLRGVEDVFIVGDYAYLPCREGERLTICSIKDPANPEIISSFTHDNLGHAAGFAIHSNTIYLASQSNHQLLVIDVTNRLAPHLIGSVLIGQPGKGVLYKVVYRDGYCYVANLSEKKIFVVDVRNINNLAVVGSVSVTEDNDGPFSLFLRGDYALVGTIFGSRNRLSVINIKKPSDPQLVNQIFGPEIGHLSGSAINNFYFAVNWDKNAFLVFDISNPRSPELIAKLVDKRLGSPNRCTVIKNRAYLPMVKGDGVAVLDISDRKNPKYLTSYRNPILKKTYGVAIRNDLLFVGAREGNSLVILNRHSLEK